MRIASHALPYCVCSLCGSAVLHSVLRAAVCWLYCSVLCTATHPMLLLPCFGLCWVASAWHEGYTVRCMLWCLYQACTACLAVLRCVGVVWSGLVWGFVAACAAACSHSGCHESDTWCMMPSNASYTTFDSARNCW